MPPRPPKYAKVAQADLDAAIKLHERLVAKQTGGRRLAYPFHTLERLVFANKNLAEAEFVGSRMEEADFQAAKLERANFFGANLTRANFRGADLQRADLRGASLRGANLEAVNLRQADIRDGFIIVPDDNGNFDFRQRAAPLGRNRRRVVRAREPYRSQKSRAPSAGAPIFPTRSCATPISRARIFRTRI